MLFFLLSFCFLTGGQHSPLLCLCGGHFLNTEANHQEITHFMYISLFILKAILKDYTTTVLEFSTALQGD